MFSVTQNGKALDSSKYQWNEEAKTFSSKEDNLVLDFSEYDSCTFDTGSHCTFKTGSCCTFDTGSHCTFDTSYGCTFDTGTHCTFDTGDNCTFITDYDCTFKTGYNCTFNTGSYCVIVRRDVCEIIQLIPNQTIKLNGYKIKGYTVIEEKKDTCNTCDGKIVEVDGKKYKLTSI